MRRKTERDGFSKFLFILYHPRHQTAVEGEKENYGAGLSNRIGKSQTIIGRQKNLHKK